MFIPVLWFTGVLIFPQVVPLYFVVELLKENINLTLLIIVIRYFVKCFSSVTIYVLVVDIYLEHLAHKKERSRVAILLDTVTTCN